MNAKDILGKKGYMLRLTAPIFLINLLGMAVNIIDQIMVGNYSQTAVAAIGNANQISNLLMMFFTVLNLSSVILVSQLKGAGNEQRARTIYPLSVLCNSILSLALAAACIFLAGPIFRLMQVQEGEVFRGAVTYLRITGGTLLFQALMLAYTAFLKSNSMMNWPLVISIAVNIINILGNWLLIYGVGPFPEMGVSGAAMATALSRAVGALLTMLVFRAKVGRLQWKLLRPFPWRELGRMITIGAPSAGESISYNASQLVIMIMINTMGLIAVNSKLYTLSVAAFSYMFAFSLAEANMVVTGYLLGDRQHDRAHRRVMRSLCSAVCVTAVIALGVWLLGDSLIGLFMASSTDPDIDLLRRDILSLCGTLLFIDIFLETGRATNLVMVRSLQSAGDVFFPVIANVISSWTISVGLSYVFGIVMELGLPGVWLAMMCDEVLRGILLVIRWKKGGWRRLDLVNAQPGASSANE